MHIFSKLKCSRKRKKHHRSKKDDRAASESGPTGTSTIEKTNAQSPEQLEPSASRPSSTPLVPSAQPTAPDAAPHPFSEDFEPWTQAYGILKDRERELMEDYEKHLASVQGNGTNIDVLTPRSVESIVQQLLDVREKKQWRVSLLGKEVKIRVQVEKLAKFLLWSDPLVRTALNTQPYAALAWCGVSLLLPLLTSGTTNIEAMLKGFSLIGDIQVYWEVCEQTYLRSPHRQEYQELRQRLPTLYSHIIEYQARAICHLSRAQLSRAWQNVDGWNDWNGKAEEIRGLSTRCSSLIPPLEAAEIRSNHDRQLQEMHESRTILDEIRTILDANKKQIQTNYEDQKERELLQVLASDYEDYKDFNPPRVRGTCEWFFADERFRKWRDSDTSSLLWVSAGPGCGKSVLSRALIDEQRLSTNITTSTVCYFFFKDGDERRMSAENALCAILHQLFTHDSASGLIRCALPSHKNYGQGLAQNFSELWRILMECASSPNAGEIVCVLDALDECSEESWQQLFSKLNDFYCQPRRPAELLSKLKFLVTSRPYDKLEASFSSFSNTAAYLRFDGDEKSAHISNEIDRVIDVRVDEFARDFDQDDRRKIAERLKSMEHRTYLWLHLTFDTMRQSPSEYGRRSDIEALLSNVPSKVSEAYEKILDRSKNQIYTEILLQIVLAAARPLTLDEANIALTLALQKEKPISHAALVEKLWPKNRFKSTVTNLCGLFIGIYDSKLSFIHQTAREFLIHPEREGKWKGRLNMSKSHHKMAQICLAYLSYLNEESALREVETKFPLAQYSARYWMDHARPAEAEHDVQESILNFFLQQTHAYANWGELFDLDWPWNERPMATPLYYASLTGLRLTVELLVEKGADFNTQGGEYGNALQAASYKGHQEIVQLLLKKGADVNAPGGRYINTLYIASYQGHQEIVQLLIEEGANVNAQGGRYGNALQAASYRGHQEIVQLLIKEGADVNAQGGEYGNALQAASDKGYQGIVQLLIEEGADVNAQGGWYGNALQAASYGRHQGIVQLLIKEGADVNAQGGEYGNALQAASYQGRQGIVQLLIEEGADVNAKGGWYGNALQAASCEGHQEIVQLLIKKRADVNAQGGRYGNALYVASYQGHQEIVQLLIKEGADVNAQGGEYGNALQAASYGRHQGIVQLLIKEGADVNAQGGQYGNALYIASYQGHQEIVQLLIEEGADVNAQGGRYGNALQAASDKGYQGIVQLLIEEGADVNAQGGWYGNALQAASYGRHQGIVQLLIKEGADVNAQGGEYGNALQAASYQGRQGIVQLLIEEGADVNAQGGEYGNALQAASYGCHQEIVQLLIKEGADVNAQGGEYGNALQAASYQGRQGIVQLLIEEGADVNAQGGRYGNALQAASYQGRQGIVQLLIEEGADVNAQGGKYGNALHAASYGGHQGIVQLLIEEGADVNAKDGWYGNALHIASYRGHQEIVQLLIKEGADVNAHGGWYGNALQAASYGGHQEIVQLLIKEGADVNAQGGWYDCPSYRLVLGTPGDRLAAY